MYKDLCVGASEDWNNYITNGRFMGMGLDNQPPRGVQQRGISLMYLATMISSLCRLHINSQVHRVRYI